MLSISSLVPPVTHRSKYVSVFFLAGAIYAAFIVAGLPLVGVGAWVVVCVAGQVYRCRLDRPLFDERDRSLYQTAAARTIRTLSVGAGIVFPGAVVFFAVTGNESQWPRWLFFLSIYTMAFGLFFTGVYLYTRYEQ